jgi:Protein of unknown function (DUF3147)
MRVRIQLSKVKRTSWKDYCVRFFFGGTVTVLTGLFAKEYGPVFGGLFLAFPAIFPASSTLIEKHQRRNELAAGLPHTHRGRLLSALDARGAAWGSLGLMCFGAFIWRVLPRWNSAASLLPGLGIWLLASVAIWRMGDLRRAMRGAKAFKGPVERSRT